MRVRAMADSLEKGASRTRTTADSLEKGASRTCTTADSLRNRRCAFAQLYDDTVTWTAKPCRPMSKTVVSPQDRRPLLSGSGVLNGSADLRHDLPHQEWQQFPRSGRLRPLDQQVDHLADATVAAPATSLAGEATDCSSFSDARTAR